jgi:DNA-binding NarL/FixJ family response regulator
VRVDLAEDGVLFREGLARLMHEVGFTVAAQCGTADELMRAVEREAPDVVIADIRMPPAYVDEGVRAAQAIRAGHPDVGVLVLSQYVELGLAMELLEDSLAGVGYLLKDRVQDIDEFADAIRRVAAGGSAVDPAIVSQLLRRHEADPLVGVTPRERAVLELMAEGRSNHGIAERLGVTERAVQKHITSIFQKLDLDVCDDDHRRVLAVLAFVRSHSAG